MHSIILCGGSGTRLWPLSRKNFSKQFLKLYSNNSLIQETYLRMKALMKTEDIFFITNKDGYYNVFNQIKEIDKNFKGEQILVEPESLNTAPAITYAVKHLIDKVKIKKDTPLLFVPSDHFIGNEEAFNKIVKKFAKNIGDYIGTIGITPTKPETGYGYIKKGENLKNFYKVDEFKEKPDLETAQKYIESKKYVWNSGMYIFTAKTYIKELKKHSPEIYKYFDSKLDDFLKNFNKLPSISIDYAISEKSKNVVVCEGDFGWNDIGSFDSLANIIDNTHTVRHIGIDSKNVFIHSDSNKLVTTIGIENISIIENTDSILIKKHGRGEDVKKIVDVMKKQKMRELDHNLLVYRPWGKYEVLIDQPNHKVKKITVYPGAKLSLQSHNKRSEHWVVIKGVAGVVNGENYLVLRENESTFIPQQNRHRLENRGDVDLEIIEVQVGSYLEEDDIVRYEDIYNR